MKAYVAKNQSGAVTRGWLLRPGTSMSSSMCRLPAVPVDASVEEVSVEAAVSGAGNAGFRMQQTAEGTRRR